MRGVLGEIIAWIMYARDSCRDFGGAAGVDLIPLNWRTRTGAEARLKHGRSWRVFQTAWCWGLL